MNNIVKEENSRREVLVSITESEDVKALLNALENDKVLGFSARYNSVKKEHVVEIFTQ